MVQNVNTNLHIMVQLITIIKKKHHSLKNSKHELIFILSRP